MEENKAYLIVKTVYDSDYTGGSVDYNHMVSYNKEAAEKYCKENTNYHKVPCGNHFHFTGYSYSVEELDILEDEEEEE